LKKNDVCRFCGSLLEHTFVDLGTSPLANSYLTEDQLDKMEPFYPLKAYVCGRCFLVQLPAYESPENIFGEYAYFSSYSDSWLAHARDYTEMMLDRYPMGTKDLVIEIASNDGYLLRYFRECGINVLGIEPAKNVAAAAREVGIPTIVEFFGAELAKQLVLEGKRADLLIGNNVLAHVPDLNDFVSGMKTVLAPLGIITMEFPHLMRLIDENQFDTIYHEHFSYFSLTTVEKVFARHGLVLFDVEELATHGGSLRIYARKAEDASRPVNERVGDLLERERAYGLKDLGFYRSYGSRVREKKRDILEFLIRLKREGKTIAGYGAPAKGNTLLNYCGIRTDFIEYTVDRNPHKQGCYLPGSQIPVLPPEKVRETRPDYLLILPWNLKDEIMGQMGHIREWGGRFAVLIPKVEVFS
jgi:SAM-dependent methyltransferase